MKISVKDGSTYFKGLLLLIRKDRKIVEPEIQLMKHIGKTLGFEHEFCKNAISEILDNEHIIDATPEFSTKELARKFIKDGFVIAISDHEIHSSEVEWLKVTAEKNGLDLNWFQQEYLIATSRKQSPELLEANDLTVDSTLQNEQQMEN